MSSRAREVCQHQKRRRSLASIGRFFRPSGAPAAGTRLKDPKNDGCTLEASRPRLRGAASSQAVRVWLRPGALRSVPFWLALVLIPGWVGVAMSQQTQQLPSAPTDIDIPLGYNEP